MFQGEGVCCEGVGGLILHAPPIFMWLCECVCAWYPCG